MLGAPEPEIILVPVVPILTLVRSGFILAGATQGKRRPFRIGQAALCPLRQHSGISAFNFARPTPEPESP
jgi:hypothetical protein